MLFGAMTALSSSFHLKNQLIPKKISLNGERNGGDAVVALGCRGQVLEEEGLPARSENDDIQEGGTRNQ